MRTLDVDAPYPRIVRIEVASAIREREQIFDATLASGTIRRIGLSGATRT
jgi:hypothetical protein